MSDPQTIAAYTAQCEVYAGLGISPTQQRCVDRFVGSLRQGAHVLDLGCGPGLHAKAMLDLGCRVTAIDATPAFVQASRDLGVDARVGLFDDVTETGVYDGVWASFSLLHAPKEALPGHIAAVHRALKPGGQLFMGMKLGTGAERDDLGRAYSYVTEEELTGLLTDAGFTVDALETGAERGLAGTVDPYVLVFAHG